MKVSAPAAHGRAQVKTEEASDSSGVSASQDAGRCPGVLPGLEQDDGDPSSQQQAGEHLATRVTIPEGAAPAPGPRVHAMSGSAPSVETATPCKCHRMHLICLFSLPHVSSTPWSLCVLGQPFPVTPISVSFSLLSLSLPLYSVCFHASSYVSPTLPFCLFGFHF